MIHHGSAHLQGGINPVHRHNVQPVALPHPNNLPLQYMKNLPSTTKLSNLIEVVLVLPDLFFLRGLCCDEAG